MYSVRTTPRRAIAAPRQAHRPRHDKQRTPRCTRTATRPCVRIGRSRLRVAQLSKLCTGLLRRRGLGRRRRHALHPRRHLGRQGPAAVFFWAMRSPDVAKQEWKAAVSAVNFGEVWFPKLVRWPDRTGKWRGPGGPFADADRQSECSRLTGLNALVPTAMASRLPTLVIVNAEQPRQGDAAATRRVAQGAILCEPNGSSQLRGAWRAV